MASLRILHLEDNEVDGEFVRLSLEEADLVPEITRVETRDAFLGQLDQKPFDLIVSDTPFIFVSGTIGEAVAALRNGATDYVLKDRLSRLPEAVRRCVAERTERQARQAAEEAKAGAAAAILPPATRALVSEAMTAACRGGKLLDTVGRVLQTRE
jgi:CheY-like chemotaxis protein